MAESTDSNESSSMVSNDNETTPISVDGCTPYLDPQPYDHGQIQDTTEGMCSADRDESDKEAGDNDTSPEERSNAVEKKGDKKEKVGKGHRDTNQRKDKDKNKEAEQESRRGREYRGELPTNDDAYKPVEVYNDLAFFNISEAGAKQHEVRTSERLNEKKLIFIETQSNKRRRSTDSALGNKRRKKNNQGSKDKKDEENNIIKSVPSVEDHFKRTAMIYWTAFSRQCGTQNHNSYSQQILSHPTGS